nr:MAG TPA: hypothetical protein [Caudoviricetes sp.]
MCLILSIISPVNIQGWNAIIIAGTYFNCCLRAYSLAAGY